MGYFVGGGTNLVRTMATFFEIYIEDTSFVVVNKPVVCPHRVVQFEC